MSSSLVIVIDRRIHVRKKIIIVKKGRKEGWRGSNVGESRGAGEWGIERAEEEKSMSLLSRRT